MEREVRILISRSKLISHFSIPSLGSVPLFLRLLTAEHRRKVQRNIWLIDCDSLQLLDFQGDPDVDYAILSHTWGKDEVFFADFKALESAAENETVQIRLARGGHVDIKETEGYRKISGAAQLAKGAGLQYVWVNTCCIDKTSSAELSESINSMFRWYQNASFFDKEWGYIDSKQSNTSFCALIANITGISEQVLVGTALLTDVNVANKMRWAAMRQTTRPEDTAYCLLGLFNVNMPLLYGEGVRAFVRLQEQIMRETDDQSIFLWGIPPFYRHRPDALHGLPAESPSLFSLPTSFDYVQPLPPSNISHSAPSTVTSQGLRATMLLVPAQPQGGDEYHAVLDCIASKSQRPSADLTPCIVLKRLWGDQFARVISSDGSGVLVLENHFKDTDGTYTNIYVKQSPFYSLPQILVRSAWQSPQVYPVIGAYPPESWDASLSMIRTKEPRSGRVIAVIRFGRQKEPPVPLFDVAVGLYRGHGRWSLCYEMRPWSTEAPSLQAVYSRSSVIKPEEGLSDLHKYINIMTTEKMKRGRRFLELEVSVTAELPSHGSLQPDPVYYPTHDRTSAGIGLAEGITFGSRSCCRVDAHDFGQARGDPNIDYVRMQRLPFNDFSPSHADISGSLRIRAALEHNSQTSQLERALKTLIDLGADITSKTPKGLTPVLLAVMSRRPQLVYYLMEKALSNLELQSAEFTRAHDTDTRETNWLGELPIHRAAATGSEKSFQALKRLEKGGLPFTACDHQSRSVLFHAACGGNKEIIQELVGLGAMIDLGDNLGRSPLHAAVMAAQPQAVEALLQLGAVVDNAMDIIGLTPLHLACLYGSDACVDALLQGTDAQVADVNRWTTGAVYFQPIHLAVGNGWIKIVAKLLAHGCESISGACNDYLKLLRPPLTDFVEGELVMLDKSLERDNLADTADLLLKVQRNENG
ncbi:het domain protein [Colletotrichum plurivorum]|uniref:Het domain protein n=1 Tax=Colletotrichum plurivorum TaxID=2175906 RepID=A0A8H6KQP1_9PEZI|nr:het domain protein [Colletotrichum plurivorum]